MKKLKILRAISGIDFSFMGNEEVEMSDKDADSLIEAGFAREVPGIPKVETATNPEPTETATTPVANSPWKKKK